VAVHAAVLVIVDMQSIGNSLSREVLPSSSARVWMSGNDAAKAEGGYGRQDGNATLLHAATSRVGCVGARR
jgi:hypothetical protein